MLFKGVECDQCKSGSCSLPPKWSKLTWYEQARTAPDTIAETVMFCSDYCLVAYVRDEISKDG